MIWERLGSALGAFWAPCWLLGASFWLLFTLFNLVRAPGGSQVGFWKCFKKILGGFWEGFGGLESLFGIFSEHS